MDSDDYNDDDDDDDGHGHEWCSSSSSSGWMIEQAKEELQILEDQHPNRFRFLKLEIEDFINSSKSESSNPSYTASQVLSTQASTNCRKRKKCSQMQYVETDHKSHDEGTKMQTFQRLDYPKKTRADAAIEKAEVCLRKIRELKESWSSNKP